VSIWNRDKLLGVFVDGGVTDNLGLNVAKALAAFTNVRGENASFSDHTSLILVADGSMPLGAKKKTAWTRVFSVKRVSDAMMNQQVSDAAISTFAFQNSGIPTWIASLQFGMPPEAGDTVRRSDEVLRRVRTHLDSFSLQECAVLSYCGYALIESLLQNELRGFASRYAGSRPAAFRRFSEILPAEIGKWDSSPDEIERTMRYANRRLLPLRWIGRTFGI
jgi:hypothetical protein